MFAWIILRIGAVDKYNWIVIVRKKEHVEQVGGFIYINLVFLIKYFLFVPPLIFISCIDAPSILYFFFSFLFFFIRGGENVRYFTKLHVTNHITLLHDDPF